MQNKTKVFICGLGNIAYKYDINNNQNGFVLTHAKAFSKIESFEIVGGSDPDIENRMLFQDSYLVPCYSNLADGLKSTNPELLVLASPTETHLECVIVAVSHFSLKYILCEKPLAWNYEDSQRIVKLLKKHGICLFVNYMRRVNPVVFEIKEKLLKDKKWIKGFGTYTKGLLNNGSHLVNLLQYWFGDVTGWQIVEDGRSYGNFDYEIDFYLKFPNANFFFQHKYSEDYEDNSLQIHTPEGILNYFNGGRKITWIPALHGEAKTRFLGEHHQDLPSYAENSQLHVAVSLANEIQGIRTHLCTGDEALQTSKVVSEIIKGKRSV